MLYLIGGNFITQTKLSRQLFAFSQLFKSSCELSVLSLYLHYIRYQKTVRMSYSSRKYAIMNRNGFTCQSTPFGLSMTMKCKELL